jgi:hypothetical protein
MQLKMEILPKRRGAKRAELRGGEAGENQQKVSADCPAKLSVSPRSQRLCVKFSPGSTTFSRLVCSSISNLLLSALCSLLSVAAW